MGPVTEPGTNTTLDSWHNAFYIPLSPAYSGALGTSVTLPKHAPQFVGLQRDVASLGKSTPTSDGSVSFKIHFSTHVGADNNPQLMEDDSAYINFTFRDLDLVPQVIGCARLTETLSLTYLPSSESPIPSEPDFVLNQGNYTTYRVGTDTATNNTLATYHIPLKALGLTSANFNEGTNTSFDVLVTVNSDLVKFRKGATKFRNTGEYMTEELEYSPFVGQVPEPVSMLSMLLGLPILLRRRKK